MVRSGITIFSKLFWPDGSGGELATYLIVKNVLSNVFNVTIVSGTDNPAPDVLSCCRYIHWPILKARYKPIEWFKLIVNTQYLRKLIEDTDIVYIPSHTLLPLAIVAKNVKPNVKVVLHLHNYQPLTYTSVVLASREPDLTTDIIVEYGEHWSLLRALASGVRHCMNFINRLVLYYAGKIIVYLGNNTRYLLGTYLRLGIES